MQQLFCEHSKWSLITYIYIHTNELHIYIYKYDIYKIDVFEDLEILQTPKFTFDFAEHFLVKYRLTAH